MHRPWTRRVTYGPWLAALAVVCAAFLLVRGPSRPAGAALPLPAGAPAVVQASAAIERAWIDVDFPPAYLVASLPTPLWCPDALMPTRRWRWQRRGWQEDVLAAWRRRDAAALLRARDEHRRDWLPAFAFAELRLREGDRDGAEAAFTRLRGGPLKDRLYLAGLASERLRVLEDTGQPITTTDTLDDALLASIYAQHLIGSLRLERNLAGDELWDPLKRAIGTTKLVMLARHGDVFTERQRTVPAPGCGNEGALSTHDLYNNLIVAYLKAQDFQPADKGRARELERKRYSLRTESLERNPWFAALHLMQALGPFAARGSAIAAGASPTPATPAEIARESRLWALSNAERILRTTQSQSPPYPDDPRLCATLAQATDAALDDLPADAPPALREALARHALALIQHARERGGQLDGAARAQMTRIGARLALLDAVRASDAERAVQALATGTGDWTPAQQGTVDLLQKTLPLRRDTHALAREAVPQAGDARGAALSALPDDPRSQAWRRAARSDLAASLALVAAQADATTRPRLAAQARALLQPGDDVPSELRALEASLGFLRLFTGGLQAALVAPLLALLAWLLTRWLLLELRARHDLFTSFYHLEARTRVRQDHARRPHP